MARSRSWLIRVMLAIAVGAGMTAHADEPGREQRPAAGHENRAGSGETFDAATLALQVALDRSGFSSGEIDGRRGPNLQQALAAFQRARRLAVGDDDRAARTALAQITEDAAPRTEYVLTDADVAGPFTPGIPPDLMAQAAFAALGYESPLEALGERFHASPQLLQALNPSATFRTPGERLVVPNVVPVTPSPATDIASAGSRGTATAAARRPAVTLLVTRATRALTVEDERGDVLFHAPVTTGSRRDPLPLGRWKVTGVRRDPVFRYNPKLFWDADPAHSTAVLPAGPNNPVGTAWIDISREHYGIHGTPEPGKVGHVESHGCVRLTNWDVLRVLQWARTGTRVVFR